MSLYDFFFPEQAAASHLRRLANRQERRDKIQRIESERSEDSRDRIDELERDVGVLSLILASLLETANDNGAISRDAIKQKIEDLDIFDGIRDGKLDASFLRDFVAE